MLLTPSICLAWKWMLCVRDKTIWRHISCMSDGSLEEFLLMTWTTAKLSMCKTTVLSDNKCIQNSNTITIDRQKLSKWSVKSIKDMGKAAYNHVPVKIQLKPKLLASVNRCKQEVFYSWRKETFTNKMIKENSPCLQVSLSFFVQISMVKRTMQARVRSIIRLRNVRPGGTIAQA